MLECLPGCKDGQIGKNAQVIRTSGDKTNGNIAFYKENAKVVVKCNDGMNPLPLVSKSILQTQHISMDLRLHLIPR